MAALPVPASMPSLLSALLLLGLLHRPAAAQSARAGDAGLSEVGGREAFVRLAALGAPGTGPVARKVADRLRSWSPGLVIALSGRGPAETGFRVLAPPRDEGPAEVREGPVHLFLLPSAKDSDTAQAPRDRRQRQESQARWLRKALAASGAAWKIVCLPVAPYSSAASAASTASEAGALSRWPFKDWGADAVLSGGAGPYERLRVDGLTYIVLGSGAAAASPSGAPRLEGSLCLFDEGHGAMLVEAGGDRIDFRFVTAEGVVVDSHSLRRQDLARIAPAPAVPVSASP